MSWLCSHSIAIQVHSQSNCHDLCQYPQFPYRFFEIEIKKNNNTLHSYNDDMTMLAFSSHTYPPFDLLYKSYSSFIGLLAPFWNGDYYYYYCYYYFFGIPVAIPAPAAGSVKSISPSVLIVITLPLKEPPPPPPYSINPADNLPAVSTIASDLTPSCYSSTYSSSNSSSLSKKFFG